MNSFIEKNVLKVEVYLNYQDIKTITVVICYKCYNIKFHKHKAVTKINSNIIITLQNDWNGKRANASEDWKIIF